MATNWNESFKAATGLSESDHDFRRMVKVRELIAEAKAAGSKGLPVKADDGRKYAFSGMQSGPVGKQRNIMRCTLTPLDGNEDVPTRPGNECFLAKSGDQYYLVFNRDKPGIHSNKDDGKSLLGYMILRHPKEDAPAPKTAPKPAPAPKTAPKPAPKPAADFDDFGLGDDFLAPVEPEAEIPEFDEPEGSGFDAPADSAQGSDELADQLEAIKSELESVKQQNDEVKQLLLKVCNFLAKQAKK